MVRTRPAIERFTEKYEIAATGCWVWKGSTSRGYGYLWRTEGNIQVHRFAYEHFKGAIPEGFMVLHTCHNSLCCNPDHLKVGTHADNMADMKEAGRRVGRPSKLRDPASLAPPTRYLSDETRQEVLAAIATGAKVSHIAKLFGIDRKTVRNVRGTPPCAPAPS